MEDDAFVAHRRVPPIAAYVKRVDKLMDEFTARELPALVESKGGAALPPRDIEALDHLFVLTVRAQGLEKLYSPYRTYFPTSSRRGGHPRHPRRALHRMRRRAPRQGRHRGEGVAC